MIKNAKVVYLILATDGSLNIVKQGIFTGKHYKEIYKDCKARLETVSELAFIGG